MSANGQNDFQRDLEQKLVSTIGHAKARKYRDAVAGMEELFQLLPKHPSFVKLVLEQIAGAGINKRDIIKLITLYKRTYPADPAGYLLYTLVYQPTGDIEQIRKSWRETCANAAQGFHYQPAIEATIFDAEAGKANTRLGAHGLGTRIASELVRPHAAAPDAPRVDADAGATADRASAPQIITEAGEPAGATTASLNGRIEGVREPARYFFRYGSAPDRLEHTSAPRAVPGPINARVSDFGENVLCAINAYATQLTFAAADDLPGNDLPGFNLSGADGRTHAKMIFEWPFGKDRNHKNGIGVIELLAGWKSAAQDRLRRLPAGARRTFPSATYPGEALDMRDATVSVVYRTPGLDMRAFRPVVWIHGRTGTAVMPDVDNDRAAWALTGRFDDFAFDDDGAWHRIDAPLSALSTQWSFCGSNTEEMGSQMERYTYAPIQSVLRENLSGNICICLLGNDDLDTPEGSIEISALEMSYRSRSLLSPGWGAALVSDGTAFTSDPGLLTDGTIRIADHYWFDDFNAGDERSLTWRLRDNANVRAFKVHQNPIAPARDIEIALSADGEAFAPVWSGTLDDVPGDPAAWAAAARDGEGSGFCTVVVPDGIPETGQTAQFVRLRITSSHRDGIVGLDAFEVFGDGLPPLPDGAPLSVSETADALPPDAPLFAQLVVESDTGTHEGDVVRIDMPPPDAPQVLGVQRLAGRDGVWRFAVRSRAGGTFAALHAALKSADGTVIAEDTVDVGKWDAPRDTVVELEAAASAGDPAEIVCSIENASATDEMRLALE